MIAPNSTRKSSSTTSSSSNRRSLASQRSLVGSNRPDVLLHFSSHHTASIGYVGTPRPRHIAELPVIDLCNIRSSRDAEAIFRFYAAPIQRIVHLLGGGSGGIVHSSSSTSSSQMQQRYFVLHDQGIYINRYWKLGIIRILQDVCGATMISFQCTIHMIPFAVASPPPLGESPSQSVVLSVYLSGTEAQCMIFANGHTLEFTYQSCSCSNGVISSENGLLTIGELRRSQEIWLLNEHSSSLIRAICLCLEKCPIQIRKEAIHNIYFAGTVLVKDFKEKVAVLLYKFLKGDSSRAPSSSAKSREESNEQKISSPTTVLSEFTQVPVSCELLRPLAVHIALVECELPSELIPWVGACIWVNYWRLYEQESGKLTPKMQWIDTTDVAAIWKVQIVII